MEVGDGFFVLVGLEVGCAEVGVCVFVFVVYMWISMSQKAMEVSERGVDNFREGRKKWIQKWKASGCSGESVVEPMQLSG